MPSSGAVPTTVNSSASSTRRRFAASTRSLVTGLRDSKSRRPSASNTSVPPPRSVIHCSPKASAASRPSFTSTGYSYTIEICATSPGDVGSRFSCTSRTTKSRWSGWGARASLCRLACRKRYVSSTEGRGQLGG